MQVEIKNEPVRVLVEVRTPYGSRWEFQEVPGTVIYMPPIPLSNGDTLTLEYSTSNTHPEQP